MKALLTAATLAAMTLAVPPAQAATTDPAHAALDACVQALVAKLGEQQGKVPTVRETRYPKVMFTAGENLDFTLFVADARAAGRPVVQASCTASPSGKVLALSGGSLPRM